MARWELRENVEQLEPVVNAEIKASEVLLVRRVLVELSVSPVSPDATVKQERKDLKEQLAKAALADLQDHVDHPV